MRRHVTGLCSALLVLVMLAACGQVPRPFQPRDGDQRIALPSIPFVKVERIDGAPKPLSEAIAKSAAEFLQDHDIPADAKEAPSNALVLTGFARTSDDPDSGDAVILQWALTDAEGNLIGEYRQPLAGPEWKWDYGDPRMITVAGSGVAGAVAKMLETPEDKLAQQAAAAERRFGLMVTPVTGAPGDGDYALTRAIRNALRDADVTLSDDPRQAVFRLLGTVEVRPGRQKTEEQVKIIWRVIDHQRGKTVGEASQANVIAKGSLDGRWGEVAGFAALAAVDGIKSLLNEGKTLSRRAAAADGLPPEVNLPGQPGRAPPPGL